MIGPLLTLIRGEPGMAERILAVHVDDGTGRCRRCVSHDRPAAVHPCLIRLHAAWAVEMADGRIVPIRDRPRRRSPPSWPRCWATSPSSPGCGCWRSAPAPGGAPA